MSRISQRRRTLLGWMAGTAAAGAVGGAGYAWGIEPHWVEVVRRTLAIDHLPERLEGATLVQVSDLHVGRQVDGDYLRRCFDAVRALAPELLVVTGDVVSARDGRDHDVFEQLGGVLARLPNGRLDTLAVLGNHDYGSRWSDPAAAQCVCGELERAGARVLRNACTTVAGLDIVGVDDLWALRADPVRALARRSAPAALVLCHNPDALDVLEWGGYRGWVLAGHTHGGQCRPPLLAPPILPVRNRRYAAGEVRLDDGRRLYVNRGLGHLERVRFNVRPEITVFTLVRGASVAG